MIGLLDLRWVLRCEAQLREMADDPDFAAVIVRELDRDPELREQLAAIYVRALRTLERAKE
ncbi:MAG TPA: hypothetical protein ENK20_02645 [Chromatiales bacterium]|nr:hypothetical protein [Chromatiales bacterium]